MAHELKGGQQVLSAYSVVSNYLCKCFKIKRTNDILQFHTISCLNNQYLTISIFYYMPDKWVARWMGE